MTFIMYLNHTVKKIETGSGIMTRWLIKTTASQGAHKNKI